MNSLNKVYYKRKFAFSGAALFTVGLFTGIWTAMALTAKVQVTIPHLSLATHLNALLGGLWLISISATLDYLNYSEVQFAKLYWLAVIPAWANWFVTLVASFIGVNGLAFTENRNNNIVAVALQSLVVLPALVGSLYWIRGFVVKGEENV